MPKGPNGQKRPADVVSNAVHVMRVLTGEAEDSPPITGKSAAAQELGRAGGKKRAANMSRERRAEIARNAAAMRRFTRLTNGHSKKVANHAHMVALYALFYNFIRTHGKLRMSPAMAAGIADTFLSFEDVLARVDAKTAQKARGPYKPRSISN